MNPSLFTLYIGLWDVYDTVLIKIFQVSPKPFVYWTARFKRDLCGWRAKPLILNLRQTSCLNSHGRAHGWQVTHGFYIVFTIESHARSRGWPVTHGFYIVCTLKSLARSRGWPLTHGFYIVCTLESLARSRGWPVTHGFIYLESLARSHGWPLTHGFHIGVYKSDCHYFVRNSFLVFTICILRSCP